MSAFRIESIAHCTHLAKHSPTILRCFLSVIGDNFDTDVNCSALIGLAKVVTSLPDEVVVANLSEIVGKIFPFFDNARKVADSAAAMNCLASLSDFVIKCCLADFKDIFRDLVSNDVIVSLILHVNDENESKRESAKNGTAKIFELMDDEYLTSVAKTFPAENFDYVEFLHQFSKTSNPKIKDFFPAYISRLISYFKMGNARIRSNAVVFVTSLIVECRLVDECRAVCVALSKLLSDPSAEVQKTVASNFGKVLAIK